MIIDSFMSIQNFRAIGALCTFTIQISKKILHQYATRHFQCNRYNAKYACLAMGWHGTKVYFQSFSQRPLLSSSLPSSTSLGPTHRPCGGFVVLFPAGKPGDHHNWYLRRCSLNTLKKGTFSSCEQFVEFLNKFTTWSTFHM